MTPFPALTPRRQRLVLDLLTAAVAISVAIALAGLTWRIAGHAGTGAITVPSGRSAPTVTADVAPALALAPFGKPAAAEAGTATSLPLELKGVIAVVPAELSTAYIAESGQPAKAYTVGQTVAGATIQGILRDRVILGVGGRTEYLPFPDPTLSAEARAQAAAQPAPAGPAQPAPPAPPAGSSQGASPAALLQRFNASPVAGGFRVGDGAPPGLKAGDVIQSVNGRALSDPASTNAALSAAQAAGSAQIVVVRDGRPLTLTIPIRQ